METKKTKRYLAWASALVLAVLLAVCAAAPALAAEDVPAAVLAARDGVVRILGNSEEYISLGSGFLIGDDNDTYIITNHHVVEDMDELRAYYKTGKYVDCTVVADYPTQDICILEPARRIPGAVKLPIRTTGIETGIAVFTLGFPGAADEVTGDLYAFIYGDRDLVADKEAMTTTDGIVSAVRDMEMEDGTRVKTIQTNASFSSGNSGGPMIDANGNVLGINTYGAASDLNMNFSIHASELVKVLRAQHIDYTEPAAAGGTVVAQEDNTTEVAVAAIAGILVLFGAAVLIVLFATGKIGKKSKLNLLKIELEGNRYPELEVFDMTKLFLAELLNSGTQDEIGGMLAPENIVLEKGRLELLRKGSAHLSAGKIDIYPGYSAPEAYRNKTGAPSNVYFVGAMMYTLLTGSRPDDALTRAEKDAPLFAGRTDTLKSIVNAACAPSTGRIGDLNILYDALGRYEGQIRSENMGLPPAYAPQQMPAPQAGQAQVYAGQAQLQPPAQGAFAQPQRPAPQAQPVAAAQLYAQQAAAAPLAQPVQVQPVQPVQQVPLQQAQPAQQAPPPAPQAPQPIPPTKVFYTRQKADTQPGQTDSGAGPQG